MRTLCPHICNLGVRKGWMCQILRFQRGKGFEEGQIIVPLILTDQYQEFQFWVEITFLAMKCKYRGICTSGKWRSLDHLQSWWEWYQCQKSGAFRNQCSWVLSCGWGCELVRQTEVDDVRKASAVKNKATLAGNDVKGIHSSWERLYLGCGRWNGLRLQRATRLRQHQQLQHAQNGDKVNPLNILQIKC